MLCEFCHHDFDDSLTECPYCHKKVDFEAKSLTREERDDFAGTTIEMEDPSGEGGYTKRAEYQEKDSYYQRDNAVCYICQISFSTASAESRRQRARPKEPQQKISIPEAV